MSTADASGRKIPFTCPHCGHFTEVEPQFAGQSGPCVSCTNLVTVPTLQAHISATSTDPVATSQPASGWVRGGMIAAAVLCVGVLGIVVYAILQPAFQAARDAARCSACDSNLQRIGMALEDYYQEHGEYPPAVVRDESGKAMHSWRVLLLPHLGPQAARVHELYDMNEPWDSKKNAALVNQIPAVYECPSDIKSVKGETSYRAVVGPRTLINRDVPVRRRGADGPILTDNASETLVIIESDGSGVNWLEPKDIPVAALRAGLNSGNPAAPGSQHAQGVNILMADQSVLRVETTVSTEDLQRMATIDGNNEYIEVLDELAY